MALIRRKKKQFLRFSLGWAVVLIAMSFQPDRWLEKIFPHETVQNTAHAAAYAILAYLLCFYLRFRRRLGPFAMTPVKSLITAFGIAVLWGGLAEWAQVFGPEREPSWADAGYNAVGAVLGILIFWGRDKLKAVRF